MERKLASIQRIDALNPIEKAEAIEVADILGWKVVVKKGEFKVGDACLYCEIDSILPERPEFEFLREKKFRIKTVKLRGQVSQGIAFSTSVLPSEIGIHLGDDVTALMDITKYEPYIPPQLSGMMKGNFPSFIPKTDETRIQSVPDVLIRHKGKKLYGTEKLEGTSTTFYLYNDEFGVCSRNIDLKETEGNSYWQMARALDIENKLRSGGVDMSIQGELCGPGIEGNIYKLTKPIFRAYNIFDIRAYKYMDYDLFISRAEGLAIETVPVVVHDFELNHTVSELLELADGASLLHPEAMREGIVYRPYIEERDYDLGRFSFKVISNKYLLKYGK